MGSNIKHIASINALQRLNGLKFVLRLENPKFGYNGFLKLNFLILMFSNQGFADHMLLLFYDFIILGFSNCL